MTGTSTAAVTRVRPQARTRPLRLFATAADEPRARRASDVILLAGASVGLAMMGFTAVPPPGFDTAVARFLASVPDALDAVWQIGADLLVVLAAVAVIASVVRRRRSIVRDLVLAAAVASAISLLVGRVVQGSWPELFDALRSAEPPPRFPSPRLAVAGAVVVTASPHLTLPARRTGRWILAGAALSVALLGAATPIDAVAGILVAAIAASLIHLVFGSSGGRPGLDLVQAALAELGVITTTLGAADRQPAGVFVVHATDGDGQPLVVKVYGRDAHDSALLTTLWRTVWYREPGSPLRLGRVQQVEHEAFLTLFARQAGILTDTVVTAGATSANDALLVLRRSGELADTVVLPVRSELVGQIWRLVHVLGRYDIAHGQLDDQHLLVRDGELGLVDFRGATLAANETQRRTDEVQAFVTTVILAGQDAALSGALDALGGDGVRAMLPFLQPSVLTSRQRRQLGELGVNLDRLRATTAARIDAEAPPLQQLHRISWGSIVRVVLPALAVVALISGLSGLDLAELAEELRTATWWLVAVAVIVAQAPRLSQAVSTLGASPVPLPLGPVYALQLAVSYINLAIPTSAARVAVNIRFFQRHGVPAGSALAAGALDGFGGFVVQAGLLTMILLLTPASLDLSVGGAVDSASSLLVLVVVLAGVAVAVIAAVPPWRRFVLHWVRRLASEALAAVRNLRSPRRLVMLLGGNLATEVLFASALALFVRALGASVTFGEALFVNISVALLAGLLPIPGGIGVAEGGLTFGLVQFGVPEETAFAAVMMYRMWTFYLPPIWGYFAMRWLERNQHL